MVNYRIGEDVQLIREMLNLSRQQFAQKITIQSGSTTPDVTE